MIMKRKKYDILIAVAAGLLMCSCAQKADQENEPGVQNIVAEENSTETQNAVAEENSTETQNAVSEESSAETQNVVAEENSSETETGRNLTEEELGEMESWVNNIENYGFFLSSYDDPKNADYKQVFYIGAGMDASHDLIKQEVDDEYLRITGDEEVMTDITVLRKSDIDDFLHKKVGLGIDDINFDWVYSPTYELYYYQH